MMAGYRYFLTLGCGSVSCRRRLLGRHRRGRFTMDSVRSHSPGQRVALAFAARAGVAALAALVMACSSGSNPVGADAGTDSGAGHPPPPDSGSDSGFDAHADGPSEGS